MKKVPRLELARKRRRSTAAGTDQQLSSSVTQHGAPLPLACGDNRRRRCGAAYRLLCHATDSVDTDCRDTCEYRRPCLQVQS